MSIRDKVLAAAATEGAELEKRVTREERLLLLQRRLTAIRDACTAALADAGQLLEEERRSTPPPEVAAGLEPCPTEHADTATVKMRDGTWVVCGDCGQEWPAPAAPRL